MPSRRPLPVDLAVAFLQHNRGYQWLVWTCRMLVVLGVMLAALAVRHCYGSNAWAWSAFAAAAVLYFLSLTALCSALARLLTDGHNLIDAYRRESHPSRAWVKLTNQVIADFANPIFDRLPPLY